MSSSDLNIANIMKKREAKLIFMTLFFHLCQCKRNNPNNSEQCLFNSSLVDQPEGYLVRPDSVKMNLKSYAGFLNGKAPSKMFFWFFPSEANETDPLIVWLQGDIGTSSIKAIFENNGPWYIKENKGTKMRTSYWSQITNVLYLDTAVGVGFSHSSGTQQIYPENTNELVVNLFDTLESFFKIFKMYRRNELYLAGDGFACTILTKLATKIENQPTMKLKGLIIENGFCDPNNAIPINNHLFTLKMYDLFRQSSITQTEKQILDLLRGNRYVQAFDKYDQFIKGLLTPYKTLFMNSTHYTSTENLLHDQEYRNIGNYTEFVTRQNIMCYLRLQKETQYNSGKNVLKKVRGDLMMSSTSKLGHLLSKYNVLMYFGQMNPEITPKGAYLTAISIKWCGSDYFGDDYLPWFVNNKLAGYLANVITQGCPGSFTWAMVRNAGKNIAAEKPEEVKDLIKKFLAQKF